MMSEKRVSFGMTLLFFGVIGVVANTFDPIFKGKIPSLAIVILISLGFLTAILKWLEVKFTKRS